MRKIIYIIFGKIIKTEKYFVISFLTPFMKKICLSMQSKKHKVNLFATKRENKKITRFLTSGKTLFSFSVLWTIKRETSAKHTLIPLKSQSRHREEQRVYTKDTNVHHNAKKKCRENCNEQKFCERKIRFRCLWYGLCVYFFFMHKLNNFFSFSVFKLVECRDKKEKTKNERMETNKLW